VERPTSLAVNIPLLLLRYIVARFFSPWIISLLEGTIVRSRSITPLFVDALKFFLVSCSASEGRKDVGTRREGSIVQDPLTCPFDLEIATKLLAFGGGEDVDKV
jgi:hypothetical protein